MILVIVVFGILSYSIWKKTRFLDGSGGEQGIATSALYSIQVSGQEIAVKGRNLEKVEIWAVLAGTGVTADDYQRLGNAVLSASSASQDQTWLFRVPENPVPAIGIFARGYDKAGNQVKDLALDKKGAADIYNLLWGPAETANNISEWDNSRIFSYGIASRFGVKLDKDRYPEKNLKIEPGGIIREVSEPAAETPYYEKRYEAVRSGTTTISAGDFRVIIRVYDQTGRQIYENKQYGFSFSYPPQDLLNDNFSFPEVTDNPLARIDLPRNDFMRTNLFEASFIVGASKEKKVLAACLKPFEGEKEIQGKKMNGVDYKTFEAIGAAAGNRYETVSYRAIWNDTCYGSVLLLHSGNIYNFPAGTVNEFDRAKALSELEGIADTLRIGI